MKDIIIQIGVGVGYLLAASIIFYAAKLLHEKLEQLKQKTDSESLKYLIEKIDYIVQVCVEATNQTFVEKRKQEGAFTEEEQKTAFQKTFNDIQNMITEDDKQKIVDSFGDISTFITSSIENYIKSSKDE